MTALELQIRLKKFSYRCVNVCKTLSRELISEIIAKQLIRSAFSSSANYRAACRAQTKKSFAAKLSIALEEIDESLFWLEVILDLELHDKAKMKNIISEAEVLVKILSKSRKTSLDNQQSINQKSTNQK